MAPVVRKSTAGQGGAVAQDVPLGGVIYQNASFADRAGGLAEAEFAAWFHRA